MPEFVRRWKRRLTTFARFLDTLESIMTAPDRDLITTILAALTAIPDAIRARDAYTADLERRLREADAASAADAQADAEAMAPVADVVERIVAALAGSSVTPDTAPEPIPVEEAGQAVEEAVDANTSDTGSVPSDASAGDGSLSEPPTV